MLRVALCTLKLPLFHLAVLLPSLLFTSLSSAQLLDNRVSDLTAIDRQYMDTQRELANDLTLRNYGSRCCRSRVDLNALQRLLNDRIVAPTQTRELQAMGVVLGDLLAQELGMQWVVYEDINGRSRALRLGATENYLFPVTMISRRYEAGDLTPVVDVYQKAVDAIEAARPPLPFQ